MKPALPLAYFFVLACGICLGVGLAAPCITITPRLGEFTGIIGFLKPSSLEPKTFSVVGSIVTLFREGEVLVATVIFLFSVIFPLAKLLVLAQFALAPEGKKHGRATLEWFGKYSMVDVFVVALVVLAVKNLPGGSLVRLRYGIVAFGTAAVLSMFLGAYLKAKAKS
jgi:paraquat-inducible protein A